MLLLCNLKVFNVFSLISHTLLVSEVKERYYE